MRAKGPKKLKFHVGVKKCHFGNFSDRPGWPCPVSEALKNPSLDLKNSFVLSSYEFLAMLEGNIGKGPFFRVQSDEFTV